MKLPSIKEEKFAIETNLSEEGEEKAINIAMRGEVNMLDPFPVLNTFFTQVHDYACSSSVPLVKVDLKMLKFINSSGIKVIINWIRLMRRENVYNIHFICDATRTWQKLSFSVLKSLAMDRISFEY